jgi:hypothetical protein
VDWGGASAGCPSPPGYQRMEIGENCEEFGASPKMKFLSLCRNVFRKRHHLHFSVEEKRN